MLPVEEPPDYTDALDLPADGSGDRATSGVRSVSMYASGQARRRSSGSAAAAGPAAGAASRGSRLRSRLFSRSVSATGASLR